MRRSICYCEPSSVLAGDIGTWTFTYKPANPLPAGTKLKFDLQSKGRAIDWQSPEKGNTNGICMMVTKGKPIAAKVVEAPDSPVPQYEFTLPVKIDAGKPVSIFVGNIAGGKGKKAVGNRTQTYVQRRRPFLLYVDPTGKGHYGEPEVFTVDIRGNVLHTIRVLTPSYVTKNRRFDVTVRFEDEFGNLTSNAQENVLIELSYENLRESLNWKLFVPETGFITLPNLYFNEEGVYTIRLKNLASGEIFRSSPIKCFNECTENVYWGVLHGESERIDSTENIENCLRHFRDDKALNFFSSSSFESPEETSNDMWKLISQNISDFNEEDRFCTFLGSQWCGEPSKEGARLFVFGKDNKPLIRKKETKYNTLKKIYRSFAPKELIAIPLFTMAKGYEYHFNDFEPEFERVVEIYNSWGSSECSKKEGNPLPIGVESGNKGVRESAEGSLQAALQNNCRFGFVGGGLDDRGIFSGLYDGDQTQYPPGLTAILSETQSREALYDALYHRACYATTGERIIVGVYLAGKRMGSELDTEKKPGLLVNRHISGYIAGTKPLSSVEIIRNGKVLHTIAAKDYFIDIAYDDMVPLEDVVITPKKGHPFVYYYLRVTQEDGHMAWSSPIWVDMLEAPKRKIGRNRTK